MSQEADAASVPLAESQLEMEKKRFNRKQESELEIQKLNSQCLKN